MSSSPHKITFAEPLRDVRVHDGFETLISQGSVERLIEEKFRSGFEAGQKALGEQLVEQRKQLLELQTGVLRSLEKTLPTVADECEKSLVFLALETAHRLVEEIPIDARRVEQAVRGALKELKETTEYEVQLHPDDLAMLREVQSGLLPASETSPVRFNPDARVARGDCVVNTRHGSIARVRADMARKLESAVVC